MSEEKMMEVELERIKIPENILLRVRKIQMENDARIQEIMEIVRDTMGIEGSNIHVNLKLGVFEKTSTDKPKKVSEDADSKKE